MAISEQDRETVRRFMELYENKTDGVTMAAAGRGISPATLRQRITAGEVEVLRVGREVRIWRGGR